MKQTITKNDNIRMLKRKQKKTDKKKWQIDEKVQRCIPNFEVCWSASMNMKSHHMDRNGQLE